MRINKDKFRYANGEISLFLFFLLLPFYIIQIVGLWKITLTIVLLTLIMAFLIYLSTRYIEFDFNEKTIKINTLKHRKTINIDDISYYKIDKGYYYLYNCFDELLGSFRQSYMMSFNKKNKHNVFFYLLIPEGKNEKIGVNYAYYYTKELVEADYKDKKTAGLVFATFSTFTLIFMYIIAIALVRGNEMIYTKFISQKSFLIIVCVIIFIAWLLAVTLNKKIFSLISGVYINVLSFNPLMVFMICILLNKPSYTDDFANYRVFDRQVESLEDFFYEDVFDNEVIDYYYFVDRDLMRIHYEITIELKVDEVKYDEIYQHYSAYENFSINTFEYDQNFNVFEYRKFECETNEIIASIYGSMVLFNDKENIIIISSVYRRLKQDTDYSYLLNRFSII